MGKTWDTEKIEKFIESFAGAYDRYTDDLHSLEDGMSKYYFNETYRGQAAEASKNLFHKIARPSCGFADILSASDGGGANPRYRALTENRSRWSLDLLKNSFAARNHSGSRT